MSSLRRELIRFAAKRSLPGTSSKIYCRWSTWHRVHIIPFHSYSPFPIHFFSSSSTSQQILDLPSTKDPSSTAEKIPIIFIDKSGKEIHVLATVGKNLLEIAHENNIELEGACGGELACATCHLVFEAQIYESLPKKLPEEDDMLDLAFKLTDTSRLGCQIRVKSYMAGMKIRIPDDGY